MVVISLAKDLVLNGSFPTLANTGIELTFVGIAVSAMVNEREWYHKLIALLRARFSRSTSCWPTAWPSAIR